MSTLPGRADRAKALGRARGIVLGLAGVAVTPGLAAPYLALPPIERHHFNATIGVFLVPFVIEVLLGLWLLQSIGRPSAPAVGLFVACCAAFALHMSVGVGWTTAVGVLAGIAALAAWASYDLAIEHRITASGIPATATVIDVLAPVMNVVVNNVYVRQKVRIEVVGANDGERIETTAAGLFRIGHEPKRGDRLSVLVDPARRDRVLIDTTGGA